MTFSLSSTAFKDGGAVPIKYTCDGADVSPPLAWIGAPAGTQAFALIADDPDAPAGTWVHWVLYNLPATVSELPENIAKVETLDLGSARQGRTDFRPLATAGPSRRPDPATGYSSKFQPLTARRSLRAAAQRKAWGPACKATLLA